MKRIPTMSERIAEAVEKLTAALAGRGAHAAWCGLMTRKMPDGIRVDWRDALTYESGPLLFIPRTERNCEVIAVLSAELTEWKARASAAPEEVPPQKESRNAEREKCVRRLDSNPHHRAVARRAAAR